MKKYISIAVLMELLDGNTYTCKQLSDKYEVSSKTIYRAIETLCEAGIPIVSEYGRNGGYKIFDKTRVNCSFFTKDELCSFFSFLETQYNKINPNEENLTRKKLEIFNQNKEFYDIKTLSQQVIIDTDIWGQNKNLNIKIDNIKNAICNRNKLKITYKTSKIGQKRIIHPYSLVYKFGCWYIYSYCETRQNFRLFKLSRIADIEILTEQFIRQNINCLLKPWNKDFEENFSKIEIIMKYDISIEPDINDWLGTDIEELFIDDNYKIIKTHLPYCKGLIHKILEFEDKLIIISPSKLCDEIKNQCEIIRLNYKT